MINNILMEISTPQLVLIIVVAVLILIANSPIPPRQKPSTKNQMESGPLFVAVITKLSPHLKSKNPTPRKTSSGW